MLLISADSLRITLKGAFMTTTSLRRLRKGEENQLGKTMSAAFFDDPLMKFMVPDDSKRMEKGNWFMSKGIGYCAKWGEVYTDDAFSCGASWLTPGNTTMSTMRILRAGLWQMPFRIGFGGFSRFNKLDSTASAVHKKHVTGDHWYLLILGTHPEHQGTGLGSAAIELGASKAGGAGMPVYLETMTESNVEYYTKRGFTVAEEFPDRRASEDVGDGSAA